MANETKHCLIDADATLRHDTLDTLDVGVIGKVIDLGKGQINGCLQLEWDDLVGYGAGILTMYTSVTGKRWIPKNRITYKPNSATGEDLISLNGVVSEPYARLIWEPNGVTAGRLNCYVYNK